jgi:hypothetical protein
MIATGNRFGPPESLVRTLPGLKSVASIGASCHERHSIGRDLMNRAILPFKFPRQLRGQAGNGSGALNSGIRLYGDS